MTTVYVASDAFEGYVFPPVAPAPLGFVGACHAIADDLADIARSASPEVAEEARWMALRYHGWAGREPA